jgi:high-affinity nickel-transport protein
MSIADTADSVFMTRAYGWAFSDPLRKVYYNITITSLSVAIALLVGTIELLQVVKIAFGLDDGAWSRLGRLDPSTLGYLIVGLFVLTWSISTIFWKTLRLEERWDGNWQR